MSEDIPNNSISGGEAEAALPRAPLPEKPFVIEMERLERHPAGYFRPHASLKLSPSLRTSGLLAALPPDELRSLLFMLSFLHANGHCTPTVNELSQAMRVSRFKAQSRMRRLTQFQWEGEPIAFEISRESGLDAFSPAPSLVDVRELERVCPHCGHDLALQPVDAAELAVLQQQRREQVVASSRESYARPRAEVERTIARMMGWKIPGEEGEPQEAGPETAETMIRQQLAGVGVSREQIEFLLAQFDVEAIHNQLEWLPYRKAKNRAAFLVAAIEKNYEAPLALRSQAALQEAEAAATGERERTGNDSGV